NVASDDEIRLLAEAYAFVKKDPEKALKAVFASSRASSSSPTSPFGLERNILQGLIHANRNEMDEARAILKMQSDPLRSLTLGLLETNPTTAKALFTEAETSTPLPTDDTPLSASAHFDLIVKLFAAEQRLSAFGKTMSRWILLQIRPIRPISALI